MHNWILQGFNFNKIWTVRFSIRRMTSEGTVFFQLKQRNCYVRTGIIILQDVHTEDHNKRKYYFSPFKTPQNMMLDEMNRSATMLPCNLYKLIVVICQWKQLENCGSFINLCIHCHSECHTSWPHPVLVSHMPWNKIFRMDVVYGRIFNRGICNDSLDIYYQLKHII